MAEFDAFYQVLLIGETCTGKTWLLRAYLNIQPVVVYNATIGANYHQTIVTIPNERRIKFLFWDTSGIKRFRSITFIYFRPCRGFLVLFDSTSKETFDLAISYWL